MTEFNVRADYAPGASARDLDDEVEALKDLHVAILQEADGARSFTLTLNAEDAFEATEEAVRRVGEAGADRALLLRLDVLPTVEFDLREDLA